MLQFVGWVGKKTTLDIIQVLVVKNGEHPVLGVQFQVCEFVIKRR